jgi:hypothetical protein
VQSGYGSDRKGRGNATPPKAGGYGGLGESSSHHEMRTNAGRNELISNTLQCQKAHGQSGAHGDNSWSGDDGAGCHERLRAVVLELTLEA